MILVPDRESSVLVFQFQPSHHDFAATFALVLKAVVSAQIPLKGPAGAQGGQANFDGLSLPEDYGKNEQRLWHALCVMHPLLPDSPCRIDFQVSDHAGLAEAKRLVAEKNQACSKAGFVKVSHRSAL